MASYKGNIDLLSLNGAKVIVGVNGEKDNRPYLLIPCDLNEIRLEAAKNDASKQTAKLRVQIWPFSESYKAAARRGNLERGDGEGDIATHEMRMNYSVDYIKAVAKNFPKLVDQVKEAGKEKDPEIVNQDYNDENSHLFKAIRNRMNKRLAQLYQPKPTNQSSAYTPSATTANLNSATGWVPPSDGSTPDYSGMPGYNDPNSDLPF